MNKCPATCTFVDWFILYVRNALCLRHTFFRLISKKFLDSLISDDRIASFFSSYFLHKSFTFSIAFKMIELLGTGWITLNYLSLYFTYLCSLVLRIINLSRIPCNPSKASVGTYSLKGWQRTWDPPGVAGVHGQRLSLTIR